MNNKHYTDKKNQIVTSLISRYNNAEFLNFKKFIIPFLKYCKKYLLL
jgi:hypothetical protein